MINSKFKIAIQKDAVYRGILSFIPILLFFLFFSVENTFGSQVDWMSQHVTFPDYFRKLFQEERVLYPNLALQLGGGQNMAELTYYGLLRPDVLLSYCFPSIQMNDWLSIISIFYMILSSQLCYTWMKYHFTKKISFFCTCIMILSGPMFFHTHRHIMFYCYFSGLLLAFIGVDRYLVNKKIIHLVFGVFFTILLSYYYSITSLIGIELYTIYQLIYNESDIKLFIKKLLEITLIILLGIGLSAFFLIPTASAIILQKRPSQMISPSFIDLLIPKASTNTFLYSSYSIGMSGILIFAIFEQLLNRKKCAFFLSFVLLIVCSVPGFQYVLNGFQYIRAKGLIPLIPLCCFVVGNMLNDLKDTKKASMWSWILTILFVYYVPKKQQWFYILELCLLIFLYYMNVKKKKSHLWVIYLIVPTIICYYENSQEMFLVQSDIVNWNQEIKTEKIKNILDKDSLIYRFDDASDFVNSNYVNDTRMLKTTIYSSNSNQDYTSFMYDVMKIPSLNPHTLSICTPLQPYVQGLMGVKYLYSQSDKLPYGYEIIDSDKDGFYGVNQNVLPLAYVSYQTLDIKTFHSIPYPYSLESIYRNVIVENGSNHLDLQNSIKEIEPKIKTIDRSPHLIIQNDNQEYYINAKQDTSIDITLEDKINGLLIIDMKLGNDSDEAITITINDVTNRKSNDSDLYANKRYSFNYYLYQNEGIDTFRIHFSRGKYSIRDIKCYEASPKVFEERKKNIDELKFREFRSNKMCGEVYAKEQGYFVTSLPYELGYSITVDGETIDYEKVNTSFVGFPIEKGMHEITISYYSPGKALGIIISMVSLLAIYIINHNKKVRLK